ncbi:MAG: hypothetical protein IKG22_03055 [Atopobiaceae bacterium]|nr:hypothetical protein [Atopobiaceae bacterium]
MVLRLCLLLWLAFATPAYALPKGDAALLTPIDIQCEQQKDADGTVKSFAVRSNTEPLICDVGCRAYSQETGWQECVYDGQQSGKAGKRIEAIRLHLRGLAAQDYHLWYRVKVRKLGWTNWTCDGSPAGAMGMLLPIRSIQVRLRHTYEKAPRTAGEALLDHTLYDEIAHTPSKRAVVTMGEFTPSKKAAKAVKSAIRDIRKQGYDVGFVMMDLATHQGLAYNCGTLFYGASSIKAPYMASAIELHPEALKRFKRQIQETLTYSWDDTYKEITKVYGEEPLFGWVDELELESDFKTFVPERPWAGYTARDFAKMWVRIHQWSQCTKDGRTFCSWSEHPETSTIHHVLGGLYKTQSKAGWIQDDYAYWNVTNDGGIVYADNGPYVLAIMSSVPADFSKLHDLTRALDRAHSEMLAGT